MYFFYKVDLVLEKILAFSIMPTLLSEPWGMFIASLQQDYDGFQKVKPTKICELMQENDYILFECQSTFILQQFIKVTSEVFFLVYMAPWLL